MLNDKLTSAFDLEIDDVISSDILIYGDFMVPNSDIKMYSEVTDFDKVSCRLSYHIGKAGISSFDLVTFCFSHTTQ